ncbi:MAG: hypothetical protein IJO51_09175 [Clostridia bacterium]|nr:hypothetical protein [Clostridia bacterium]
MKKPYKILLFLSIGLAFFLLLWHLSGSPGFTPGMAMRMTERSHLLEDNELLVQNPTYYYGPEPRYDFVTTDGEYLYYGQARGDAILYWNDFGRWNISDFHRTPKGEHISYIGGNLSVLHHRDEATGERYDCDAIPLYIFIDGIDFDEMHGLLEIEANDLFDELPWQQTYCFTAEAEPIGSGHVLWFDRSRMALVEDPDFDPADLKYNDIDYIWHYTNPAYTPYRLTVTLYRQGAEVYTETITLTGNYDHDWR